MRILILGAGVVGVTTAWGLLEDGHEVTVVDRHPEAAGDQLRQCRPERPAMRFPGPPARARTRSVALSGRPAAALPLPPIRRSGAGRCAFLGNAPPARARQHPAIKHRLCAMSQQALQQVVAMTGVAYDGIAGRSPLSVSHARRSLIAASRHADPGRGRPADRGARPRAVSPSSIRRSPRPRAIAGALFCPRTRAAMPRLFSRSSPRTARERGADFATGPRSTAGYRRRPDRAGRTDRGDVAADVSSSHSAATARSRRASASGCRSIRSRAIRSPSRSTAPTTRRPGRGRRGQPVSPSAASAIGCALTSIAEFAGYDTCTGRRTSRMLGRARLFPTPPTTRARNTGRACAR